MSSPNKAERLQKIIAMVGLASRREAEDWIEEGLVTVNGKTAKLGDKAVLGEDAIKVKGKLLSKPEQRVYYAFYKPKNVISILPEDEEGRATLSIFTKRLKERVFPIGKLDFTTEGLMILSNDGDLLNRMQGAKTLLRTFQIKVNRHPDASDLLKLAKGGRVDGKSIRPYHVKATDYFEKNASIELSIEGMKQVDLVTFFKQKGFLIERIKVSSIGHLTLSGLKPGELKPIKASSIEALFVQPELAKRAIEFKNKNKEVVKEKSLEIDQHRKRIGRKSVIDEKLKKDKKVLRKTFQIVKGR